MKNIVEINGTQVFSADYELEQFQAQMSIIQMNKILSVTSFILSVMSFVIAIAAILL